MPQTWVRPELFMKHQGCRIYHTYRHDVFNDGRRLYLYSLLMCGNEVDEKRGAFDVRELPNPAGHNLEDIDGQKAAIQDALDSGFFDDWEKEDPEPELTGKGLPLHTVDFMINQMRTGGQIEVEAATPEEALKIVEGLDPESLLEHISGEEWSIDAWLPEAPS